MSQKVGQLPGSWRAKHEKIPSELVPTIYRRAMELAATDPSPVRVARLVSGEFSLSLSPGTVRHWIVGDRTLGAKIESRFTESPSPALSYIIGAVKGDGCAMVKTGIVKLSVTDLDFAKAFNDNMATLFSRSKPNTILVQNRPGRLPMYIVKYQSRKLVMLLRQPLAKLFELVAPFPREFLRGFFDAEGYVSVGITSYLMLRVGAENSNKELLSRIMAMLKGLNIRSNIYRKREKGTVKTIRGETFTMRRTSHGIEIGRFGDVKRFADEIGFSVSRKRQKAQDAFSIIENYKPRERPEEWMRLYSRAGGEWVRLGLQTFGNQSVSRMNGEALSSGPVV